MENTELLNTINAKLDEVLALLKAKPARSPASEGMTVKGDVLEGEFRVVGDPKPWSSNKGVFLNCKPEGDPTGDWYSVGLSFATAEKVFIGYLPKKGDTIHVRGNYKEEEKNGKTYKSVFAFSVQPKQLPLKASHASVEQNEDVPF